LLIKVIGCAIRKPLFKYQYSGEIPLGWALMHRAHQTPADRAILHGQINANRPNTCNRIIAP
jgi:hypothetical protein